MVDNSTNPCHKAADCTIVDGNGNEILKLCYKNVPWSDEPVFCDCSSWYGYVGEYCDQSSVQLIYFKLSLSVTIIWSLVFLPWTLYEWRKFQKAEKKRNTYYADLIVLLTVLVAFCCVMINAIIQLLALADFTRFKHVTYQIDATREIEAVTVIHVMNHAQDRPEWFSQIYTVIW